MLHVKLTVDELNSLRFIAKRERVWASEISEELEILPAHTSRVIARLKEEDLIRTEKVGLSKQVSLSDTKHAALFRKLTIEFSHMPLDELLSGPSLEVLSAVSFLTLKNRREITENSLVSEPSVTKALEKMKQVGIVQKRGQTYTLPPRFQTMKEFVMEFRSYLNQRTAREFAGDAVVEWECNTEFIIECSIKEEKNGFHLTGVSMFPKFGIPLIASKPHFFYSPFAKELRLEDVIVHSLLVRERNILPILLAWKKNEQAIDRRYLEKQGEKFKAKDSVKEVSTYFSSKGVERAAGFPPWNEFLLRAKEYRLT